MADHDLESMLKAIARIIGAREVRAFLREWPEAELAMQRIPGGDVAHGHARRVARLRAGEGLH